MNNWIIEKPSLILYRYQEENIKEFNDSFRGILCSPRQRKVRDNKNLLYMFFS